MLICTSACRQKTYKRKKSHLKRRIAKPYYLDLSIKSKNETMNMCVNAYIKRWKTVLNEQKKQTTTSYQNYRKTYCEPKYRNIVKRINFYRKIAKQNMRENSGERPKFLLWNFTRRKDENSDFERKKSPKPY